MAILEIHLHSETILGGDGVQKGTVDMDVQTDQYGLPYLSGRTLKGLLRKEAKWFIDCLPEEKQADYKAAFNQLFGQADQGDVHHANYDALRFSTAKLGDALYDKIDEHSLLPHEVLQSMTTIRSMTSIDDKTGTAKDHSLRQARTIHAGYSLFAPIFIQRLLTGTERALLQTAVKLLRHIGLMRNRGKGEVSCKLYWTDRKDRQQPADNNDLKQAKGKYIQLAIDIQEPLKINSVLRTSDSTYALNYIPGHVIRGALIHAYLQNNQLGSKELDTETLFNEENIQFWNGYVSINKERSLPFPQHLFETKESSKTAAPNKKLYSSFVSEEFNRITESSPVKVSKDAMIMDGDQLVGEDVQLTSSLHIALNAPHLADDETKLYRYEGIAPNQQFQAIVKVNVEDDFVTWLRQQKSLTLWLGGARNSGYGRSRITTSIVEQSPEQFNDQLDFSTGELYVIATSNWIVYDRNGQLTSELSDRWLSEQLGIQVKLTDQVVLTDMSGGYVSHWRAYQPMIQAVEAGSIFRYKIVSGDIDVAKIQFLIDEGVGIRKNEGFGRLTILPQWKYQQLQTSIQEQDVQTETVKRAHVDEQKEEMELDHFIQEIVSNRLEQRVQEKVNEWYESIKKRGITNSQWGKLLEVAFEVEEKIGEESADREVVYHQTWQTFWADSKHRLENKSALGYDAIEIHDHKKGQMKLDEFTRSFLRNKRWTIEDPIIKKVHIDHLQWSIEAFQHLVKKVIRSK